MKEIKLFEVNDDYIDYLRTFDDKVLKHSGNNYTKARKYIGVLLEINGFNYIAPLSSPNLKTDYVNGNIRKSITPIIRIVRLGKNAQLLGTIKLSSMIPVLDMSLLSYYNINNEKDIKYKNLVQDELRFIYANKDKILKEANKLYNQKIKNMGIGYIRHTVDFLILENKAKLYKK